jgi:hypothetical protein
MSTQTITQVEILRNLKSLDLSGANTTLAVVREYKRNRVSQRAPMRFRIGTTSVSPKRRK